VRHLRTIKPYRTLPLKTSRPEYYQQLHRCRYYTRQILRCSVMRSRLRLIESIRDVMKKDALPTTGFRHGRDSLTLGIPFKPGCPRRYIDTHITDK
jgi:hypothetical protein